SRPFHGRFERGEEQAVFETILRAAGPRRDVYSKARDRAGRRFGTQTGRIGAHPDPRAISFRVGSTRKPQAPIVPGSSAWRIKASRPRRARLVRRLTKGPPFPPPTTHTPQPSLPRLRLREFL